MSRHQTGLARGLVASLLSAVLLVPHGAVGQPEAEFEPATLLVQAAEQLDASLDFESADEPEAVSLSLHGVRYQAVQWGKARGLPQNGGYISAVDEKTGVELWLVQVYQIKYDPGLEGDVQDVFIRKISVGKDENTLLIENDKRETFSLNLKSRKVKKDP